MHIKFKKRLGQNFLFDKNVQRNIIAACDFSQNDLVLEIGAGKGELTRLIADTKAKILALEIDSQLCKILKENLQNYSNVKIINQDILKFNLKKCFGKCKTKLKVIGNIPYYITTPILQYLIRFRDKIESIFITVQKEFAKRILAPCGGKEYGSFSCFIQCYTSPQIKFFVKRTCFRPQPKVDSCFLKLEIKRKLPFKKSKERLLFKLIRKAFNKRRKTLRNSLEGVVSERKFKKFFSKYNIDPNCRPETLSLKDFINLISA